MVCSQWDLKKTKFSFISGYKLERASGLEMLACVHFHFQTQTQTWTGLVFSTGGMQSIFQYQRHYLVAITAIVRHQLNFAIFNELYICCLQQ